jgi:hypothetical protein
MAAAATLRVAMRAGVLERWSIALSQNCTPHARGWECFQGTSAVNAKPKAESFRPWGMIYSRFVASPRRPRFNRTFSHLS